MSLKIILASASPRRYEYLAMLGLDFSVHSADIDETPLSNESPHDLVCRLSLEKVKTVAALYPQAVTIAADTIVVLDNIILGKPTSPDEAYHMLRQLRNREHWVYSAISLLRLETGQKYTSLCGTRVTMRPYTHAEMSAYVASGDPMDKAGAYAIQNASFDPVATLDGCYASVVGLPLADLAEGLGQFGLDLGDVPTKCSRYTGHPCCMQGLYSV